MSRKPKTAQQLCDDRRRRHPPSVFFIGDPPCVDCRREVALKRKGLRNQLALAGGIRDT